MAVAWIISNRQELPYTRRVGLLFILFMAQKRKRAISKQGKLLFAMIWYITCKISSQRYDTFSQEHTIFLDI